MCLKLIFLNTISLSQIHKKGTGLNPQTFQVMGMTTINNVRYIMSFFSYHLSFIRNFYIIFLIGILNFFLSFNHVNVKF
jgi:hypothetical protein